MDLDELSADISKAYEDLRNIEESLISLAGKERFGAGRRRTSDHLNRLDTYGHEQRDVRTVSTWSAGINKRHLVVSADNDMFEGGGKRARNEDRHDEVRRTVQSSIVMPAIETKSREAAISELKGSEKKEVNVRNRRMFSNLLLGTLQRFQNEEKKISTVEKVQAEKQKEVERRLRESEEQERERLAKERAALLDHRRQKEQLIKSLQRKKAIIQYAEQKQEHYRKLQKFIQTEAKPPIFYLPAKHTLRTLELLKISTKKIDDLIEHRRLQMEADLKSPDEKQNEETVEEGQHAEQIESAQCVVKSNVGDDKPADVEYEDSVVEAERDVEGRLLLGRTQESRADDNENECDGDELTAKEIGESDSENEPNMGEDGGFKITSSDDE